MCFVRLPESIIFLDCRKQLREVRSIPITFIPYPWTFISPVTNSPCWTERGNSSHCSQTSGFQNKILYLPCQALIDIHFLEWGGQRPGGGARASFAFWAPEVFITFALGRGQAPALLAVTLWRTHLPFYEKSRGQTAPQRSPRSTREVLCCPWKQTDELSISLLRPDRLGSFPSTLSVLRNKFLDSVPHLNSKYWSLSQPRSWKFKPGSDSPSQNLRATEPNNPFTRNLWIQGKLWTRWCTMRCSFSWKE